MANRDLAADLHTLIGIWRQAPNREIADVIVELGAHVRDQASWDNIDDEPSPRAITPLLHQVLDRGSVKARPLVERMEKWPSDPRIDRWVAAQYQDPPATSSGARPFWTRLAPLGKKIVDAAAAATILKARAAWKPNIGWQAFLSEHVDRFAVRLTNVQDAPFDDGLRELLVAVRAAIAAERDEANPDRRGDAAELLAAVLANPSDDAPRIVLGDVLLEQGDPRGELIALQLKAKRDRKREKAIIKESGPHLLGSLAEVLRDYEFERGFLSRAALKRGNARALESAIVKTVGNPLWATVEHLEGPKDRAITVHPVMRSLRSLVNSDVPAAKLSSMRLESLVTHDAKSAWGEIARNPSAFTELKTLDIFPYVPAALELIDSPLVKRLDTLQLRLDIGSWNTAVHDSIFGILARAAKLGPRDVTIRLVRHRDNDWSCGFRFAGGTIAVFTTRMNRVYEALVAGDLLRGLDVGAMTGSKITLDHKLGEPWATQLTERIAQIAS